MGAGTRGLDRGVERQDVGLERDAVDHAGDVADAVARRGDLAHAADDLRHRLTAAFGGGRGGIDHLVGGLRGIDAALHRVGELFDRTRGLLQRAGGLVGAAAQILAAVGDLAAGVGELVGQAADAADQFAQLLLHRQHGVLQAAEFVVAANRRGARVRSPAAIASATRTVSSTGRVMLRVISRRARRRSAGPPAAIAAVVQIAHHGAAVGLVRAISPAPAVAASWALSMPLANASIFGCSCVNSSALAGSICCARCRRLSRTSTTSTLLLWLPSSSASASARRRVLVQFLDRLADAVAAGFDALERGLCHARARWPGSSRALPG
jgi:hypothetical protein